MSNRIAHLIDTGGPGGAETVFARLVDQLDGERWNSIPVVPGKGWLHDKLGCNGYSPVLLRGNGSFDVGYLYRLIRLLRHHDVDLIQTHLIGSAVYGNLAARVCGLPVVSTFHGTVDVSEADLIQRMKFRIMDRPASRTVFVSESLRRDITRRTSLRPGSSTIVHNGVEPEDYSARGDGEFRAEAGAEPDQILVGAVGNIRPAKDYSSLLQAAALLSTDEDRYRFAVVGQGDGPLLRELKRMRSRLGLEDVLVFTGFREDIPRILADLDIYVLTSSSEGFSISTVQALASRLPVVATRCGGPEEIISDGVHGLLVEPGRPEALAGAVRRLVRDPEGAERMGRAGRSLVERTFTVDRMVEQYEKLYDQCL